YPPRSGAREGHREGRRTHQRKGRPALRTRGWDPRGEGDGDSRILPGHVPGPPDGASGVRQEPRHADRGRRDDQTRPETCASPRRRILLLEAIARGEVP